MPIRELFYGTAMNVLLATTMYFGFRGLNDEQRYQDMLKQEHTHKESLLATKINRDMDIAGMFGSAACMLISAARLSREED